MTIPKLERVKRHREYDRCQQHIIDEIIYQYLFEGLSHRKLDEYVVKEDPNYSRGYTSMGVLHYLGMKDNFKGLFKGCEIEDIIRLLEKEDKIEYADIIDSLKRYSNKEKQLIWETEIGIKGETILIENQSYREGKHLLYYSSKYERNYKNRKNAIEIHGTTCSVCGFNFKNYYGEWGDNFIEIHHIKPLHSLEEEIKINAKYDLIPVCSNCHSMLHRQKNKILSIEDLKSFIKGQST